MGILGNAANKAKQKAKQKAKDAVKTAVLGDTEFVCSRCHRSRSRVQVTHLGSKTRKPPVWVCKNIVDCKKAIEKTQGSNTIRHRRGKHPGALPMDN